MRTNPAPEWQRFLLGLAICVVASIWGLVALHQTLSEAHAQANNDNDAEASAEEAPEEGEAANGATTEEEEAPAEENGDAPEEPAADDPENELPDGVYRMAFVNMEAVIRAYPRWWAKFEQIRQGADDLHRQLQEERSELQRMRNQLEETPDPTDELLRDYAQRLGLLERNARAYESQFEQEMRDLSERVYDDVYDAIEEIAEGRFDVVMGVSEREIRTGSQAEFFQKIPARAVVIHPEENELTRQLIARMEVTALLDRDLLDDVEMTPQELLSRINEERERAETPSLEEDLEELEMHEEFERVQDLLG